jgi:hypothetical protein
MVGWQGGHEVLLGHCDDFEAIVLDRRAAEADVELAAVDRVDLQRGHQVLKLELDTRVTLAERPKDRRDHFCKCGPDEAYSEPPRLAVALAVGRAYRLVDVPEDLPRFLEQRGASLGQIDASAATVEEPEAEFVLELPDLLAERRLRNTQQSRGPAAAPSSDVIAWRLARRVA